MKPSPVRLFSTTSTPAPPVASRISSPNAVVRLSNTCSTPSERRYACLGALAVAKTSATRSLHPLDGGQTHAARAPRESEPARRAPVREYSKDRAAETKALGMVASPV